MAGRFFSVDINPAPRYPSGMATKKAKANPVGRPELPPSERRSRVFCFRLREDEIGLLERAAKAVGNPVKDWARDVLLRAAKRRVASE